jgi:catechol 2,3-dioxygenase-like lactoylglutathione lyase family enzyme
MPELAYRLLLVRIFVRDFERAVRFYTETLGMPLAFRDDAIGWAQLRIPGADLALERDSGEQEGEGDDGEASMVGRFVGVSLAVDDIDHTYQTLLARGVEFLRPPQRMPWGGVLAHLRDPDGNVLTLAGTAR